LSSRHVSPVFLLGPDEVLENIEAKCKPPPFPTARTMGSLKRKRDDPGADVVPATIVYLKRGDLSILSAISAELPDVFTEHLLPKLGLRETLSLAQVNKTYRDAVWSVGGVRSLKAKMKAQLKLHHELDPPNFGEADPMLWAAKHGNVPAVKALLESGEDVNRWISLESRAEYCTALHIAAEHGHAAVTKILIEAGADVNAQRDEGNTPLYDAVMSWDNTFREGKTTATVALLINAGADVNKKSNEHSCQTPLSVAVGEGNVTMVTLLIQAGADVNKADKYGQTPLTLAVKRDTLFKSTREKRLELMERNRNYRKAILCDPEAFTTGYTCNMYHECSPRYAIETLEKCSVEILDMLRNAEYMRSESK